MLKRHSIFGTSFSSFMGSSTVSRYKAAVCHEAVITRVAMNQPEVHTSLKIS